MLINNDRLIELVLAVRCHAVGQRAAHVKMMVSHWQQQSVLADSRSHQSQSLLTLFNNHRPLLEPKLHRGIAEQVIMAVDGPVCDAIPTVHQGQQVIIIFQGLLRLIRFYTELQLLISLLDQENENLSINGSDEVMQIGLAASVAGHAMMCASLEEGHLLVDLSHLLGPRATQRADYGYGAAVTFLLLHEYGHHVLGHLSGGFLSEQAAFDLPLPESGGRILLRELEADAYALESFLPEYRAVLMSSIVFAMAPFAFMESFSGPRNPVSHPLTANRLAAMGKQVSGIADETIRKAIHSIVDDELARYRRLSAQRAINNGDISGNITRNMPLTTAYQWLSAIEQWIGNRSALPDFEES